MNKSVEKTKMKSAEQEIENREKIDAVHNQREIMMKNAQKRDIFDHQSGDLESRLSNLQSAIQRMQATDESGTLTEAEALAKLVNSGQAQLGDILAAEKYGIIQLGAVESRAIQERLREGC